MKITAATAAELKILTAAPDGPGTDIAHSLHEFSLDARPRYRHTVSGSERRHSRSDPLFTATYLIDGRPPHPRQDRHRRR
ncbi:MAG: hypothetical protein PHQ28_10670 [Mycobacterium sp.]|nr:hypothetical protein [Mycobacterium sp.]